MTYKVADVNARMVAFEAAQREQVACLGALAQAMDRLTAALTGTPVAVAAPALAQVAAPVVTPEAIKAKYVYSHAGMYGEKGHATWCKAGVATVA